ncbi:MAG TPA: cupredoxin domain-containing protein [Stellaceae bacterium]|jgi:uncharacterized cupredoxin-like copper-binding protein|nr:cupredoxin domain-containing protein [Stellaceae bacterium]
MSIWGAAIGLAVGLAAAPVLAADIDWSKAKQVDDIATEYAFTPAHLQFRAGTPYRLRLVNRGKETHEFTAPEFFATLDVRDPSVLNADRTELVVQPGTEKDLSFVARKAGTYKLRCSDHDWAGMTGDIVVK